MSGSSLAISQDWMILPQCSLTSTICNNNTKPTKVKPVYSKGFLKCLSSETIMDLIQIYLCEGYCNNQIIFHFNIKTLTNPCTPSGQVSHKQVYRLFLSQWTNTHLKDLYLKIYHSWFSRLKIYKKRKFNNKRLSKIKPLLFLLS